jgi:hypothetical protein
MFSGVMSKLDRLFSCFFSFLLDNEGGNCSLARFATKAKTPQRISLPENNRPAHFLTRDKKVRIAAQTFDRSA